MPLSPKLTAWFERFYPGLISSIEALGAGEFAGKEFKARLDGPDAIVGIRLGLTYALTDGHVIEIEERLALKAGKPPYKYATNLPQLLDWDQYYYALRYKNPNGDNIIGLDLHGLLDGDGNSLGDVHHVHFDLQRPPAKHRPSTEFEPDPRNMDPRQFVSLVAEHRRTKTFPFSRKKKS